jgi:acyl-CoA synthetase (NDP forming)
VSATGIAADPAGPTPAIPRQAGAWERPAGYDAGAARRVLATPRCAEAGVLLEPEGLALADALGIATPRRFEVSAGAATDRAAPLPGERVVVKVVAPGILHKTERGGVRVVANRPEAIARAIAAMTDAFADEPVAGWLVCEHVPHDAAFGHEFLLGLRWSREYGPVVTLGPGGIHAEILGIALAGDDGLAVAAPFLTDPNHVEAALARLVPARLATGSLRGRPPALPAAALADAVRRFVAFASEFVPSPIAEFELNPLVVSEGRLIALDALARLAGGGEEAPAPRPLAKVRRMLEPRSIAVIGVSEKMNPGRMILRNVLRAGFDPARVTVVRPGRDAIDGCRCVPTVEALDPPVDLAVVSLAAAQAAPVIAELAGGRRAGGVVLIAGGLEEKRGSEALVARMRDAIAAARAAPDGGTVVNGGNCLGIQSRPGRYDTLFIPGHKLAPAAGDPHPVALVCGSGAFAVSKRSKLSGLSPRYTITIGNQMDLTAGDWLEALAGDEAVEVFAVYLEGFRTLDGAAFLAAADRITRAGRTVILYRGGRTRAGAAAAATHTAAVAGDARVGRALAEACGVVVADTLEEFEDLVRLFVTLRDRPPRGRRLAAITNAGYESVAIADRLGPFELAAWSEPTRAALRAALQPLRLEEIVAIANPIDLTPILDDAGYERIVRAALADPGVDAAVVGCVPMTGALNTLPGSAAHGEDVSRPDSVAGRLLRLRDESAKPWVAVVDGGPLYDPMALRLEEGGVPTFRTADRAMRMFGRWCEAILHRR